MKLESLRSRVDSVMEAAEYAFRCIPVTGMLFLAGTTCSFASDHSDVPQAGGILRQDANLTDLHAFLRGENLVLALCSNPTVPVGVRQYLFPSDVTFELHLDNHSAVSADDPLGMGGTILDPSSVQEDYTVRIRFDTSGKPEVKTFVRGGKPDDLPVVKFFAGPRDDPFIRGPRIGRNVAGIVLEVPLAAVTPRQSTLLIWGTSKVEDFDGPVQDLVGRALRSMMPENVSMNTMEPRHQTHQMGVQPDVMIYDTSRPAAFPNGRALEDDVVNLVGDPRILANDSPFPSTNDVPFLSEFPYLAPPQ